MEKTYKSFPARHQLDMIGQNILSGHCKNDSFKFVLRPGSSHRKTCHIFAKHKDVVAILGPDLFNNVDLSLYDAALSSGGGGAEFFISAKDKTAQWGLLMGALSISPSFDRNYQKYRAATPLKKCPSEFMENQAQRTVRQATQIIHSKLSANKSSKQNYDAVTDYGYLVTNLLVRDVVGLKMSQSPHFLYRLFKLTRWLQRQKVTHLNVSEIKQANELVFWIEVMFGQLFTNPGDHNKILLNASKFISKKYRQVIKSSIKNPIPGSLIDRMIQARLDRPISNERFEELLINIVMELVGSFQYLTGRGFAGIYETIYTVFAKELGPEVDPLKAFNQHLKKHPRAMIDEALRHNSPTGFIFRTASKDFIYNGIEISSGDLLCVLCNQAAKDSSVFKNPETFYTPEQAEKHQNDYLAFASPDSSPSSMKPTENHHPCFGQYWARTIIFEMLIGLEALQTDLNMKQT